MLKLPAGSFWMGSEAMYADRDEYPRHEVHVGSFKLYSHEVTQSLWKEIMGRNPSYHKGNGKPVESVSYYDVELFIRRLNEKTGHSYRLLTEEEWEYAASFCSKEMSVLEDIAWYDANSGGKSHSVCGKLPNAMDLYDMVGNVGEWVAGTYEGKDYSGEEVIPVDSLGKEAVFRGGAFNADAPHCRISNRNHVRADTRNYAIGFRLAESEPKREESPYSSQ